LVEVVIMTIIITVMSALIVPNVVRMLAAQTDRDAVPAITRVLGYAREAAISNKTTMVVSFDSSNNRFTAQQTANVDANAPTSSTLTQNQSATQSTVPGASPSTGTQVGQVNWGPLPTVDPTAATFVKSFDVPKTITFSTFQLAGQTVADSDFLLNFYPDGTCDGGGIEFAIGAAQRCILADSLGNITVQDGSLPDPTTVQWEAGQFEPRQGAQ
jgi:Tfp pilus assembly protein FimT